jgi:lysophospholipase L1-like esterase
LRAVFRSLTVLAGAAALLGACASQSMAPAAAVVAAASAAPAPMVDPYLAQRPTSASVGVPQPVEFQAPGWMNNNWIEQVTQMSILPSTPGGVAFVGDSITNGFRWAEAFPNANARNWGISGDTSWGVLARARQVAATKPAKIFLLIGTNDFGNWGKTPEETAAGIAAVVDLWKAELPGVQIYLQGVMPRQPEYAARITTLNGLIQGIATAKGATYVDLYTPFLAGDRLDPTVTMDDLHLTGQGYARWLSIISPCVTGSGPCA